MCSKHSTLGLKGVFHPLKTKAQSTNSANTGREDSEENRLVASELQERALFPCTCALVHGNMGGRKRLMDCWLREPLSIMMAEHVHRSCGRSPVVQALRISANAL
eukprot:2458953-Amphidinium_carterae.1